VDIDGETLRNENNVVIAMMGKRREYHSLPSI